jgi:hypothetical protein
MFIDMELIEVERNQGLFCSSGQNVLTDMSQYHASFHNNTNILPLLHQCYINRRHLAGNEINKITHWVIFCRMNTLYMKRKIKLWFVIKKGKIYFLLIFILEITAQTCVFLLLLLFECPQ